MDAIQISKELTSLGMDKKQSDFIARAIDERNKELATRVDLDRGIRSVKELLYFAIAAGGAALGYIITKI